MTDRPGVLLVRADGVILVENAIPWPTALARQVETLLDTLVGPRLATPAGADEGDNTTTTPGPT